MKVAVASFSHETCTFCPSLTTVEDYERGGVYYGQEVIEQNRDGGGYLGGFINAMDDEEVDLVGILDASHAWGGSSGSWLTTRCFNTYTNEMTKRLKNETHLDGVYLALHGAMAAENYPKAEAEIVRRVRNAVGEIPVMVTLDLHANEDQDLIEVADAVFVIKTYPHLDTKHAGETAARWMVDTTQGTLHPTMAITKPGVMSPSVFQGTDAYPAKRIMDRCRDWEAREEDVYVSVAFGFAYADVPDVGASIIAVTNNDQALAETITHDVSDLVWELRKPLANKDILDTEDGVKKALTYVKQGETPVVLADHADRLGDSTHVLRTLLNQGATNFAVSTIADPHAVQTLRNRYEVGDNVTISVGAYTKHKYAGEPVEVTGEIEFLGTGDYTLVGPMGKGRNVTLGPAAALHLGNNNHVVISSTLHQVLDSAGFEAFNIDFDSLDIMVVKSRVHFRAFFEQVARKIIEVDAPGLGPADLIKLNYQNVPEGMYPLAEK